MVRRIGFKLVEMLPEAAILLLVAGIVFAAFGPVGAKVRQTVSASRPREMQQALASPTAMMDSTDHD